MPECYLGTRIKQIYLGEDIKRGYIGSKLFFSSSQKVTYYVDKNKIYEDEINYGEPCFASASQNFKPNKFTPTKEGYTFIGWVENIDDVPNADNVNIEYVKNNYVLQEKRMSTEPIKLYALFTKQITATFKRYYNTKKTKEIVKNLYYNNNNVSAPSFKTPDTVNNGGGKDYNGWTWRGWSSSGNTAKNAEAKYQNNQSIGKLYDNAIYYGLYAKYVTVYYDGNYPTGGNTNGFGDNVYLNAYNPNDVLGITFKLENCGFVKQNYTFVSWAVGSANGTQYMVGKEFTITDSIIFWAVWERTEHQIITIDRILVGSNVGTASEKEGFYVCPIAFNASDARKLILIVAGHNYQSSNIKVHLLTSLTEAATDNNIVSSAVVQGYSVNNSFTELELDISTFIEIKYVYIYTDLMLEITKIAYK